MTRESQASDVAARFLFGTTAEWIKIEPVVHRMRERGLAVQVFCANQQGQEIREFVQEEEFLNLSGTENRKSLVSPRQVPLWAFRVLSALLRLPRIPDARVVWFVHGDTMTALLGTAAALMRREHVAHVEAGLRSSSFKSPFPEEMIRRIIGRCANTHFAPSKRAAMNLKYLIRRRNHEVILTNGNTVLDTLDDDTSHNVGWDEAIPVIVVLHRSEFLARADLVRATLLALASYAAEKGCSVGVIVDALALERFRALGVVEVRDSNGFMSGKGPAAGLTFIPKMAHSAFLGAIRNAEIVVTDSGGVQEETAALGVPCLIFRDRTERSDGLEDGVQLIGMNPRRLTEALREPRERRERSMPAESPSNIIVRWMVEQ